MTARCTGPARVGRARQPQCFGQPCRPSSSTGNEGKTYGREERCHDARKVKRKRAMSDEKERFTHNDVQVVAREQCFKGFYSIQKYHVKHRLFSGGWSNVFQRELFVRHNATCVLLFDPV